MRQDRELFYDMQLKNPELTWRLSDSTGEIIRGIVNESEFRVSIDHTYGDGMNDPLGNELTGLLNSLKIGAIYNDSIKSLNQSLFPDDNNLIKNVINEVTGFATKGQNFVDNLIADRSISTSDKGNSSVLHGAFMSAFDIIKTFTGTEVSINFPRLETTLLHGQSGIDGVKSKIKDLQNKFLGDIKTFDGVWGIQYAPNDYKPILKGLSDTTVFPGTFKLDIGSMYSIDNLIVRNFTYEMSTQRAMGTQDALYAVVSFEVEPASYISKAKLLQLMKL